MQAELDRCIATTQRILSALGGPAACSSTMAARGVALLHNISAAGIPRIKDSRVSDALNNKLHGLAELYFRKACSSLQETHAHRDLAYVQSLAFQLKATYTQLYERQVINVANSRPKTTLPQKQPFANDILAYAFEQSQSPTRRERERLAALTGLTHEQVRVWFQNRRSRQKKKAPEVRSRPVMQLPDLLERVVASARAIRTSVDTNAEVSFDDDYDSGYCSGEESVTVSSLAAWSGRREPRVLARAVATERSFPAPYVPQSSAAPVHLHPPAWRQTSPTSASVDVSTVTVDELARSMARLTLRHRRPEARSCTTGTLPSVPAVNASTSTPLETQPPIKASKNRRRESETRRPIAGGRRVTVGTAAASTPSLVVTSTMATTERKRAGLPRRKPVGKALSRHASDSSFTSTSGTSSSSRSSSYASDFSLSSVASDLSTTSVESAPSTSGGCEPSCLDAADPSLLYPTRHSLEPDVPCPVYDLSAPAYDAAVTPSEPGSLFVDPTMLHLLQNVQDKPSLQYHNASYAPALDNSLFDIGFGSVDLSLDFSSTSFPSLEALLSETHFPWVGAVSPMQQALPILQA